MHNFYENITYRLSKSYRCKIFALFSKDLKAVYGTCNETNAGLSVNKENINKICPLSLENSSSSTNLINSNFTKSQISLLILLCVGEFLVGSGYSMLAPFFPTFVRFIFKFYNTVLKT